MGARVEPGLTEDGFETLVDMPKPPCRAIDAGASFDGALRDQARARRPPWAVMVALASAASMRP